MTRFTEKEASGLLSQQEPGKLFFITSAFTFITSFLRAYSGGMMESSKTLDPCFKSVFCFGCLQFSKHCLQEAKFHTYRRKRGGGHG